MSRSGNTLICLLVLSAVLFVPINTEAQTPQARQFRPLGFTRGQETTVTVSNPSFPNAQVITSFSPEPIPHQPEKPTQFTIAVPNATPLGIHSMRLVSEHGATPLTPVIVDRVPITSVSAKNVSRQSANLIQLPSGVEGTVIPFASRWFQFDVVANQRVVFELWARRIGSSLDPMLTLYKMNSDGSWRRQFYVDDTPGLAGDVEFEKIFEQAGTYAVELRDAQHRGGATFPFYLRMGDFHVASRPFPGIVNSGKNAAPSALKWSRLSISSDPSLDTLGIQETVSNATLEVEPNETFEQATMMTIGSSLAGKFSSTTDSDRYRFTGTKDQRLRFHGRTRDIGWGSDLVLELFNSTGKSLGRVDDTGTTEGTLDATLPADGDYQLVVTRLTNGPESAYRVDTEIRVPSFQLQLDRDAINVPRGNTQQFTITSSRLDYDGPISLGVEGLPDGVVASEAVLGPKQNRAVMTITTNADVPVRRLSSVRIIGSATIDGSEFKSSVSIENQLRSRWSNVPILPGTLFDDVVLSSSPAVPLVMSRSAVEVQLPQNGKASLTITAVRGEKITEAITLTTLPAKNAVPAGLGVALKPIAKGQNEIAIELTANDKVPVGPYSLVLQATHKLDKTTTTAIVPGVVIHIVEPKK